MASYMSLLVDFLDAFLAFTATDAFWADHKTYLQVIPFTTQLNTFAKITLDYSDYASAQNLRDDDIQYLNEFKDELSSKSMHKQTFMFLTLLWCRDKYTLLNFIKWH